MKADHLFILSVALAVVILFSCGLLAALLSLVLWFFGCMMMGLHYEERVVDKRKKL